MTPIPAATNASAGRLAASTYAVPAIVVLLSWLLLAEVPAPLALAGGALCLVGVAVATLPMRRAQVTGSSSTARSARS